VRNDGYFIRPLTEGRHDRDTVLARVAAVRASGAAPVRSAALEDAVERWETADDPTDRQRASELVHILCRVAEASARAAERTTVKRGCGCAMRHACECPDTDCVNGWLSEDRDGWLVAVRCPQCPAVVRDAPLDPWS